MELVKWNKARQAIVEAKSIDEVKSIIDKAEAMRVYAKQIKESLEVQNDVAEIKLRAQRRAGEMLRETVKAGNPQFSTDTRIGQIPVDENGKKIISFDDSSKWQKIANLEEESFEGVIDEIKQEGKELTSAFMVNTAKKIEREIKIDKQEKDIKEGKIELPKGEYEVIVVDPPWNYGRKYDPKGSRVANPYPEMEISDLEKLDLPSAKDSMLWLWTTHKFIWDAKELLEGWGFEHKAMMVWDKEKMGMGAWLRMQCEFCLVGVKGKPIWKGTDVRDIIRESRTSHSTKPETLYKLIDENCVGRKIDYFARKKRKGWASFGDEVKQ